MAEHRIWHCRSLDAQPHGLFGLAASTVMFLCSAPDHAEKVSREVRPPFMPDLDELLIENYYEKRNIAIFSVAIIGDLLTFAGGVKGMYTAPSGPKLAL